VNEEQENRHRVKEGHCARPCEFADAISISFSLGIAANSGKSADAPRDKRRSRASIGPGATSANTGSAAPS
jgi:hypothetical protein